MTAKTQAPGKTETKLLNVDRSGILQRKCDCGKSASLTGQCSDCNAKNLLQRRSTPQNDRTAVPSILHEALHPTKSSNKAPVGASAKAPAPAPPDKELISSLFAGDAELKEVLNRRKLLKSGSKGDAVKKVQEALLQEGYDLPKFGVDGKFGGETDKAVREFQERWGMAIDGIVGDQTVSLLDIHLAAKSLLAAGEQTPIIGGLLKRVATTALDTEEADRRKSACPAADKAERLTACIQPVAIANDDGTSPTAISSLIASQRIWEKCCINLSVLPTQVVNKTNFKTLDESPTNAPTAEETALFTAAGASSCIQVFVPETFEQAGVISKSISGGGGTYDAGTAHPKIVVVEGAVPEVIAHEIGHAIGFMGHDPAVTVMRPTGAHNIPNSRKVSPAVCATARTGTVLSKTSGKDDCCMFPK